MKQETILSYKQIVKKHRKKKPLLLFRLERILDIYNTSYNFV